MAPGLTMPAFSPATSARVGPRNSTWSSPMLVTTATPASTTLVASQRPPEADLEDGHVDRAIGEPAQRGPGQDLEPGQPDVVAEQRLEAGQVGEHLGQVGVADGLAVGGQPLVDALQMRAGEGADPQPLGRSAGRSGPAPSRSCRWCR